MGRIPMCKAKELKAGRFVIRLDMKNIQPFIEVR